MLTNKVSEIMTTAVITAEPSSTIREVTRLMVDRRVGRVVIIENDAPVGIFTEHGHSETGDEPQHSTCTRRPCAG